MAAYGAEVVWSRGDAPFAGSNYSRGHAWRFDSGVEVPASAAPGHVPARWSPPGTVDPEEAFVAALASCHMLFFLALASKAGHVVDRYVDKAEGRLAHLAAGRRYMAEVILRPQVTFAGDPPPAEELAHLHHQAHDLCYIANSVTAKVTIDTPAG